MNNPAKGDTVTPPNYTEKQVAALIAAAPLDLASARAIVKTDLFKGKSYQSIIAKCKTEGIEYIKLAPPTKKPAKVTKAELVAMIAKRLDRNLDGLEKATSKALLAVLNGVQHEQHVETENAES